MNKKNHEADQAVRFSKYQKTTSYHQAKSGAPTNKTHLSGIISFTQVKENPQQNERYLRTILETTAEGFVMVGRDGRIMDVNHAYCAMSGYASDELLAMNIRDVEGRESPDATRAHMEKLIASGSDLFETRHRRKDGRLWPVEVSVTFVAVNGGQFISFCRDLTERRTAEEKIRESEAQFRALIDGLPDVIMCFDSEGRHLFVSDNVHGWNGLKASQFIGKTHRELGFPENLCAFLAKSIFHVFNTGTPIETEFTYDHPHGAKVYNWRLWPELDNNKNVRSVISISRDITEHRKIEARYQHLYNNVRDAIVRVEMDGRVSEHNEAYLKMLGYTSQELAALTYCDLTPQKWLAVEKEILEKQILPRGYSDLYEKEYRRKDGSVLPVELSVFLITDDAGKATGMWAVVRDITEKKQIEERLRRAEKMEALGLLAGGVAHDLNNVIGISTGYAEMLLEDLEPESPLRIHVNNIMEATQRASAVVQDMLTMARRGVTVNKVVNVNKIIAEFTDSPELAAVLALHPQVEIKTILVPSLLNISGSPFHLIKTLLNLVTNAAESIRNCGVICLATQNVHLDRPVKGYDSFTRGDYVVISVSDTGDGIAAENLGHIFEPFYTKKTMGRSGTGLGLAVVWGVVKDHNGYIDVASKPGQGTVFSLYFPVVREELTEDAEAKNRLTYRGRGETILVVDDVPEQCELATRLLRKLNYQAASVTSGEEAVHFLKKTKVDLVVLDMIMEPGIDGLETYRRLLAVRPGQKAVIVSGFAETDRVAETQRLGAGAYVKKPYLLESLGTAIRRELEK